MCAGRDVNQRAACSAVGAITQPDAQPCLLACAPSCAGGGSNALGLVDLASLDHLHTDRRGGNARSDTHKRKTARRRLQLNFLRLAY